MTALPLFASIPSARPSDPEPSWLAALRAPKVRHNDRLRALEAHYLSPDGLTDFELAIHINRQQTSAGKRRGELRDHGLIGETELRRPAPSGSPAIVWRITEAGRRFYQSLPRGEGGR